MTIVIAVAAPDGIILTGDSRTTTFPNGDPSTGRYRIYSDTAEKVFEICGRYGVATFGEAFIGHQTIAGVMAEFTALIKDEPPAGIDAFSDALGRFFHERYVAWRTEAGHPVEDGEIGRLGFFVAGYDQEGIGHVHQVLVPDGRRLPTSGTTHQRTVMWQGQVDVVNRLIKGVDWAAIAEYGIDVPTDTREALKGIEYELLLPITLQDAIDFSCFLARTTIDMQRFSDGTVSGEGAVPGCGGAVDILAITRPGAEWVSRPDLDPRRRSGDAEGAI